MAKRKCYLIGNWKMHKGQADLAHYFGELAKLTGPISPDDPVQVGVCTPFPLISAAAPHAAMNHLFLGAQNVHWELSGAFTGEVAVPMLQEAGAQVVIVGHSERRQYFGETNQTVAKKLHTVTNQQMTAIFCIGETADEHKAGATVDVIKTQLKEGLELLSTPQNLWIAYEPVWAIGTGLAATPEQAQEVHALIRSELTHTYGSDADEVPILYGGSMKPANTVELLQQPDIDGGLIGGASLVADDLAKMVVAARGVYPPQ